MLRPPGQQAGDEEGEATYGLQPVVPPEACQLESIVVQPSLADLPRRTRTRRRAGRPTAGDPRYPPRPCPLRCSRCTTSPGSSSSAGGSHELGWKLLSSGGTARALAEDGLPVTDVAELTGFPAILGHRVVTLHPKVHGGILADLDDPDHRRELDEHGIEPISLVVVNLYPFATDPGVELIDIGGPAMVRAAAKNHAHVGVVVDPAEYEPVLDELRADGRLSDATRRRLARAAFARTAAYDAAIVAWLDGEGTTRRTTSAAA